MKIELGKRGAAVALAVVIVLPLLLSLMFYPTAHMELKGLPFGVVSLDEGVQTPLGEKNFGDALLDKVAEGDFAQAISGQADAQATPAGESAPQPNAMASAISFKVFDSQEALDEALAAHELYGALVIPRDFSQVQLKAVMAQQSADPALAAGSVETPQLKVVLDYAKSPMVASQMKTGLESALSATGANASVELINLGPAEEIAASGNFISGMLSQMVVIMPLLICSIVAGVFAVKGFNVSGGASLGERVKRYGMSLAVQLVSSGVLSLMLLWVIACIAGVGADPIPFVMYAWTVSFALMVFFGGVSTVRGRLAAALGIAILLLGMTSAYLPVEAMPAFWQNWVVPWAPEYYMGNGLREVVFAGGSVWNQGTQAVGIYAAVGLALTACRMAFAGKVHAPKGESQSLEAQE